MNGEGFLSASSVAAILLIAGGLIFLPAGFLYAGRAMWNWFPAESRRRLLWERSLVIMAVVVTALGLVALEGLLNEAGDHMLARLGMAAYLIAASVIVVRETVYLHNGDWNYPQVVFFVVFALLSQAAFGVSLLRTALVPAWAGWATVAWTVGALALLLRPIASRRDIYYPVIHHVAPLFIGMALLAGA
jgi:hypothetical protein